MKLQIKTIAYKILVVSMITIVLSFFSASSVSQAKLKLKEGEFYYSGTQQGTYIIAKNWLNTVLDALGEIANYLLGIKTLGYRAVFVGWVEIMEILLTAILGVEIDLASFLSDALAGMDSYSQQIVNVETILFNRVPILNANLFDTENNKDRNSEEITQETIKGGNKIVKSIKQSVAKWYYIMRLIVIAFMLILLIFIGIKMAISTIASEKAVYKQMLIDWTAGMIIIFSIHYVMIGILTINDTVVDSLSPLAQEPAVDNYEIYQYGDKEKLRTSSEIETTLYESARTRAYSLKMTDGFTGAAIYAILVYFAWRFALMYFRRMINIIILTLMAPAVAASYAFNKVLTGKPKVFSTWLSEYIMNVIIQIFHVLIYVTFVSTALTLSLVSLPGVLLAFVLLNFMLKADKLVRQLFKLSGGKGSLAGEMEGTDFRKLQQDAKSLKSSMVGGTLATKAMKATYAVPKALAEKAGIEVLSKTVANVRNNEHYKKRQIEKEEKENEKRKNEAKVYLENHEEAIKKNKEIEELEEKKKKLLQEKEVLEAEKKYYKRRKDEEKVDEAKKKQEEKDDEIKKIDKEIKEKEEEIQKGFLKQQISSSGSIIDTVKENLGIAFDELVEQDKNKRYRRKKVETIRRGGVSKAFWREKQDSKAMRFKSKMKLGSLLGLDSSEEKILKSEMDF